MDALLRSKKAVMAVMASGLAYLCLRGGLTMEQTVFVVGPMTIYLPIQGAIDHRAKKSQTTEGKP